MLNDTIRRSRVFALEKMLLSHIESVISGGEGNSVRIRLQRNAFIKKLLDYCQTFNDKSKKEIRVS